MNKVITDRQVDLLQNLMEDYGQTTFEVNPEYSGRAMYGKKCIGVVVEKPEHWMAAAIAMALVLQNDGEDVTYKMNDPFEIMELVGLMDVPRTDNFGYETIVYWPEITVGKL